MNELYLLQDQEKSEGMPLPLRRVSLSITSVCSRNRAFSKREAIKGEREAEEVENTFEAEVLVREVGKLDEVRVL